MSQFVYFIFILEMIKIFVIKIMKNHQKIIIETIKHINSVLLSALVQLFLNVARAKQQSVVCRVKPKSVLQMTATDTIIWLKCLLSGYYIKSTLLAPISVPTSLLFNTT